VIFIFTKSLRLCYHFLTHPGLTWGRCNNDQSARVRTAALRAAIHVRSDRGLHESAGGFKRSRPGVPSTRALSYASVATVTTRSATPWNLRR